MRINKFERGDAVAVIVIVFIVLALAIIAGGVMIAVWQSEAPCSELGNVPITNLPSRCLQNGVK